MVNLKLRKNKIKQNNDLSSIRELGQLDLKTHFLMLEKPEFFSLSLSMGDFFPFSKDYGMKG